MLNLNNYDVIRQERALYSEVGKQSPPLIGKYSPKELLWISAHEGVYFLPRTLKQEFSPEPVTGWIRAGAGFVEKLPGILTSDLIDEHSPLQIRIINGRAMDPRAGNPNMWAVYIPGDIAPANLVPQERRTVSESRVVPADLRTASAYREPALTL